MDTDYIVQEEDAALSWSEDPSMLGDLLNHSNLPVVVKVPADNKVKSSGGGFNFHQPLFLYKELDGSKVYARCVKVGNKDSDSPDEYGPFVVIPADYQGWFQIADIEDDGPMRRMSTVARVFPNKMLSTKPVEVYHMHDTANKHFKKKVAVPGVYQVHDLFEDEMKYVDERRIVKRKAIRCMRCTLDGSSKDLMFPLEAEGSFYIARSRKASSSRQASADNFAAVYKMRDILMLDPLKQLTICLMFGKPPAQHTDFSRFMKMRQLVREHTVVGCNLAGEEKKLFELPVMPRPLFVKATDEADHEKNKAFINARDFCDTKYLSYVQELKVRHGYKIENDDQESDDGRISVVDRSKTSMSQQTT